MNYSASSPEDYIRQLPPERQVAISKLRTILKSNLDPAFEECLNYGMIGYVVPHSIFPAGYHCDPKTPLPFINIASQKNFVALYHMGIYGDENLLNWFVTEYPKHCKSKLDMGKSCIRFKKMEDIPYDLIAELASKLTAAQWVEIYQNSLSDRSTSK